MFTSLFLRLLNREASSPKNRSGEIIRSLQIQEGFRVADIGSGGGFFTLEFARRVGSGGKIYAVDVEGKHLEFVRQGAEKAGLNHVAFVQARGGELSLPENTLDLAFLRNVYHHLPEPGRTFRDLKRFLKPKGKVAIIEHKKKAGFSFVAFLKHYTPTQVIVTEMEEAGYFLVDSFDFLPEQSFNVFGLK
jgi:arsenite methyltransferase